MICVLMCFHIFLRLILGDVHFPVLSQAKEEFASLHFQVLICIDLQLYIETIECSVVV